MSFAGGGHMRRRISKPNSTSRKRRLPAAKPDVALGAEAAEHERQFREILEFCPAALLVVDEDGRLLFHNARLREILGYTKEELDFCDTRLHWHDLAQRARIIARPHRAAVAARSRRRGDRMRSRHLVETLATNGKPV